MSADDLLLGETDETVEQFIRRRLTQGLNRRMDGSAACSPENPCAERNPLHVTLYGECWTTRDGTSPAP